MSRQITDRVISNFCPGEATSLIEAAQIVHETSNDGERTMETFEHYRGIEDLILDAIETASKEAFGMRFKDATNHGRAPVVHVGPHEQGVALSVQWQVGYRGFVFDFLSDPEVFCRVLADIQAKLHRKIKAKYPEIKRIGVSHNYQHKHRLSLEATVVIRPQMPMSAVAVAA